MQRIMVSIAGAMALSACHAAGPAAPSADNATEHVSPENNVAAKVVKMSDQERNVVLIRAIMDANMQCEHVVKSERMKVPGDPEWRATCDNGMQHLVRIAPNGTANVISRTDG